MDKKDLAKFDLPDLPGVYLFKRGRKVLHVAKATSLRDRVRSYFDDDLIATRGPRLVDMVTVADRVAHEATPTVLEALVREAALIRKYDPPANSMGMDDRSFLYAVITKEDIPRVLSFRRTELDEANTVGKETEGVSTRSNLVKSLWKKTPEGTRIKAVFGPFPSGAQLREGLRLIQRIFPFFDTRKPVATNSKHQRANIEFNTQIGHYPLNVKSTLVSPIGHDKVLLKNYRKTLTHVAMYLSGRGKELRRVLEREMREAANAEQFEVAAQRRRELFALDHIQDVSLIKDENTYHKKEGLFAKGQRIEAYDTAHISGTNAIGVMAVLVDGRPVKSEYRTFRIRGSTSSPQAASKKMRKINNDIASLKEILSRRLNHPEWPFPHAIVVDGGRTQKKAGESIISERRLHIPVVAVVKDERHRPREVLGALRAGISEADAVLANAEAHRFSLSRHRRARSRNLRVSSTRAPRR
ncbi:hypothetical protein HYV30_03535 [Candidatus Kaiserbacteria bacterium]|nr:hypothetical protein [Candidatus Kaiserbacteria bacterium]